MVGSAARAVAGLTPEPVRRILAGGPYTEKADTTKPPTRLFLGSWRRIRGKGSVMDSTRVPPVRQESFQRRDSAFDQLPAWLQRRDDLVGNAKRLYGLLTSAQRTGWQPTYAEMAAELHASVRSIVRWVQQLVEARLIAVKRRGQGLTNVLTVLALVTSGSATVAQAVVTTWQTSTRRLSLKEERRKKPVYTRIPTDASAYATDGNGRSISRMRR